MEMKTDKKILVIMAYILLLTLLATFKLNTFQATYEFGWEERILVNTYDGKFYYQDDHEINSLASHFHIINIAVMFPLYYIFNHSIIFFIVQTSMMAITALIIFYFSKKYVGEKNAQIIFYLFLLFPLVINALLEDFHGIIYSAPLIASIFLSYDKKKTTLTLLLVILLVLVQEDMSLLVMSIGLYFLFIKKDSDGLKIFLIGLIAFIIIPNMIQPNITTEHEIYDTNNFMHYSYKFGHLGDNLSSIIKTIITKPEYAFNNTPVIYKIQLVKSLLIPFLLINVLSPAILIIIPLILEFFLQNSGPAMCPNSYHIIPFIPILFISLVLGLKRLKECFNKKILKKVLTILCITILLLLFLGEIGHWFSKDYLFQKNIFGGDGCKKLEFKIFPKDGAYFVTRDEEAKNVVKSIPINSSLLVPFHLYSSFTKAEEVSTFFSPPECFDYDFIIIDKEDVYLPREMNIETLLKELEPKYDIIFEKNNFYLLKKISEKRTCK